MPNSIYNIHNPLAVTYLTRLRIGFSHLKELDKIATTDANILTENEDSIVNTLLFGKPNCENFFNKAMLNASIEYILWV